MSTRRFKFSESSNAKGAWANKASDFTDEIHIGPPVGQSEQSGKLDDIVNLFSERYETLRKVLRQEWGFKELTSISEVRKDKQVFRNRKFNMIGIVSDIRRTKSGGRMVQLEDKTGIMGVFIGKENPAIDTLLPDDVIGVKGNFLKDSDLFLVDYVQFPEFLDTPRKMGSEFDPVSVAFASDIHIGSKYFLEKEWDKMTQWLNSDHPVANNIKYMVFSGDVCDGIGIYPGQEQNLTETDVYLQYEEFARKLDLFPDHITPVILPGNHDAVRPAEPQPVLESTVQKKFNSAIHTGNPARINLSGIDVLSYHGKGIDDMVPRMAHVTYEKPAEAMKEMLRKRHLAPMWGERNALSPEETDQMVILQKPDIFVTGHTHAHQMEQYRGSQLVVSSTFQGQSDFMRMLGYKPKMGYLSVYNLQSGQSAVVSFVDQDNPSAGYTNA